MPTASTRTPHCHQLRDRIVAEWTSHCSRRTSLLVMHSYNTRLGQLCFERSHTKSKSVTDQANAVNLALEHTQTSQSRSPAAHRVRWPHFARFRFDMHVHRSFIAAFQRVVGDESCLCLRFAYLIWHTKASESCSNLAMYPKEISLKHNSNYSAVH